MNPAEDRIAVMWRLWQDGSFPGNRTERETFATGHQQDQSVIHDTHRRPKICNFPESDKIPTKRLFAAINASMCLQRFRSHDHKPTECTNMDAFYTFTGHYIISHIVVFMSSTKVWSTYAGNKPSVQKKTTVVRQLQDFKGQVHPEMSLKMHLSSFCCMTFFLLCQCFEEHRGINNIDFHCMDKHRYIFFNNFFHGRKSYMF